MYKVVVITGVPSDTKGDFFAAKKLIQELVNAGTSVEWILQFEDGTQWANLASVANQLGTQCTIYPIHAYTADAPIQKTSQDLTLNTQYLTSDIIDNAHILAQRDLVIVFPSVRSLREIDYKALRDAHANVLCINEYGYDHVTHTSKPEITKLIEFHRANGTMLKSAGLSAESLGIFKATDVVPENLTSVPVEDMPFIKTILSGHSLEDYIKTNAIFFSYTNTLVASHDEDLAKYFVLCIQQAMLENKSNIDLIGRANDKVVKLCMKYLKETFETLPDVNIRIFNPFPIKNQTMLAFMQQAKMDQHPSLLTGDQSTGEAMVIGAPFIYQVCGWKIPFFHEMLELCDEHDYAELKQFLILTHLGHLYDDDASTLNILQHFPEKPMSPTLIGLLSTPVLYHQFQQLLSHVKSLEASLMVEIQVASSAKPVTPELHDFAFTSNLKDGQQKSYTTSGLKLSTQTIQKKYLLSEFNPSSSAHEHGLNRVSRK